MGVGLWAKKSWLESGRMRALELALSFWPWDVGWSHLQVESMLAAGRLDLAEQYARTFARAWPHDAEAALTRARLAEAKQDFRGALLFYQRAIVKVPGGRCHEPGYTAYLAMQARPQVQGDPALRLSARDLAACAR
jgi:tetratricopeptide (TPR) repeat protein